jgi:Tol biopolymer transport system component
MNTIRKTQNRISKNRRALLTALSLVAVLLLTSAWAIQNSDQLEVELKAAMHKELVDGDLEGAIADYKSLVSRAGTDRAIASKALLQIGKCYERLGDEEAKKAYEQLLQDYSDQKEVAAEARSRLTALEVEDREKDQGPTIQQVWSGPGVDTYGAPSPDGRYLSFVDWNISELAIRDLETGEIRQITDRGTDPYQYALSSIWSPDGNQLAYEWCEREGHPVELFIIGLDDSKPRLLYSVNDYSQWMDLLDWSPDGKQILASISEGNLALISVMDGSTKILNTIGQHGLSAKFSPDGRYVIYNVPQKTDSLERDIRVMSIDGTEDRMLVSHPADDSVLGWAPDGKFIFFLSDRTGSPCFWMIPVVEGKAQGDPQLIRAASRRTIPLGFTRDGRFFYAESGAASNIYLVKLDPQTGKIAGSPEKLISRHEGFNVSPRYSPDGKYLAYCSTRGHSIRMVKTGNTLHIVSLVTGKEREFSEQFSNLDLESIVRPRWSPDSRSILVYGYRTTGAGGIYRVNIQTGEVTSLVQPEGELGVSPASYSSDGSEIIYNRRGRQNDLVNIVSRNLNSGREKTLHSMPRSDNPTQPEISPNGQLLFMVTSGSKKERIFWVMNASGGEPRRLFELTGQELLPNRYTWAADSKHILFTRKEEGVGWQLWQLPIDGSEPQLLGLAEPSYIPELSAHPDGQSIAFSHRSPSSGAEIWVMENFLTQGR